MKKLVTTEQGFEDSINILVNKAGLLKYYPNPIWAPKQEEPNYL